MTICTPPPVFVTRNCHLNVLKALTAMELSLLTTSHSFAQQTDERAGKKTNSAGLPWWQPTAEIPKLSDFPLGPVYRIREAAKKPFSTKLSDAHIPNIVSDITSPAWLVHSVYLSA